MFAAKPAAAISAGHVGTEGDGGLDVWDDGRCAFSMRDSPGRGQSMDLGELLPPWMGFIAPDRIRDSPACSPAPDNLPEADLGVPGLGVAGLGVAGFRVVAAKMVSTSS